MEYITTPTVSEILREEFMEPLGISAYRLAQAINVPLSRVQDIPVSYTHLRAHET
mgnify:CR=1 FL=1